MINWPHHSRPSNYQVQGQFSATRPSIYQEQSQKTPTNPCSNRTKKKAKTSRRSQSSKPRCGYKDKSFHYELKDAPKPSLSLLN
ncbi:unnamed protein product [Cochlearia groenlandica]